MGFRAFAAVPLLLVLAACAPSTVPWANPGLPKDQWAADYSACKRHADGQVGWREDADLSALSDYDRARAKRQYDAYLGACMRERGYVPNKKR